MIIGFYIIASVIVNKKVSKYLNTINVKIALDSNFSLDNNSIRKSIQEKINIENFDFKIVNINTVSNEIDLLVLY